MRITIEDIRHPLQRERISNTSKFVIVEDDSNKVKILVAQTYRTFKNGDFQQIGNMVALRTPDKNIYEAHLVISVDILVRNFRIFKNRYGNDYPDKDIDSRLFLNNTLWILCHQIMRTMKPIYSEYEVRLLMTEIISAVSVITGEAIYFIDGEWRTNRDMYLDKYLLIKRKQYKHNFINA